MRREERSISNSNLSDSDTLLGVMARENHFDLFYYIKKTMYII